MATSPDPDGIFDAEFLGRLRTLFFKLRKRRQLQKKGAQQTPALGSTREFKDHRQYAAGDDYRGIDWRLYARLDRLFIRLFEQVQELHVHVLLDTSISMAQPHPAKRITALRLAAALSYLAMMNGHAASLFSLTDTARRELPPLKGQGHIHELLQHLARLPFDRTTQLETSMHSFRPSRDRKGVVFVLSDFYGESPEMSLEAVRHATRWPAETHLVHIIEPAERAPTATGELQLLDVETREVRRMWLTSQDLARYRQTYDAWLESLATSCGRHAVNYVTWDTSTAFEAGFLTLLSRGSALTKD